MIPSSDADNSKDKNWAGSLSSMAELGLNPGRGGSRVRFLCPQHMSQVLHSQPHHAILCPSGSALYPAEAEGLSLV